MFWKFSVVVLFAAVVCATPADRLSDEESQILQKNMEKGGFVEGDMRFPEGMNERNGLVNTNYRWTSKTLYYQLDSGFRIADGALKVNLIVEPPAVRRGQHATLRCLYDLGDAPLYSIKFYRGLREFYRYSPTEDPANKIFAFPGINVDKGQSNASQVVIRNVGFGLSGNFSCEVTADAPFFSTATAAVQLQVVEYPEKRPNLWADQDRYEPGDVLRANCSSSPSRPRTELRFTLNNIVIHPTDVQYMPTSNGLFATRISLKLQLQSSHFRNSHMGYGQLSNSISVNGGLVLRCTAQIGNLYQEYSEIELGVPQRDPIPARVTSSGASKLDCHLLWPTNFAQRAVVILVAATFTSLINSLMQNVIHPSCR